MREVADCFGISYQRVQQIAGSGFKKRATVGDPVAVMRAVRSPTTFYWHQISAQAGLQPETVNMVADALNVTEAVDRLLRARRGRRTRDRAVERFRALDDDEAKQNSRILMRRYPGLFGSLYNNGLSVNEARERIGLRRRPSGPAGHSSRWGQP